MNRQVNNIMQNDTIKGSEAQAKVPQPVINESGSVNVSGYVKIFDPETQEILVEARE